MPEHAEFVWSDGRTAEYALDDDGGFRGTGREKLLELLKFGGTAFGTVFLFVYMMNPEHRRDSVRRLAALLLPSHTTRLSLRWRAWVEPQAPRANPIFPLLWHHRPPCCFRCAPSVLQTFRELPANIHISLGGDPAEVAQGEEDEE